MSPDKKSGNRWGAALKRWIVTNKKELRGLGVMEDKGTVYLFYQSKDSSPDYFQLAKSKDGFDFELCKKRGFILTQRGKKQEIVNCQDFQIAREEREFFLTYKKRAGDKSLHIAETKDPFHFEQKNRLSSLRETGILVPNFKYQGQHLMYTGEKSIFAAYSKDLKKWNLSKEPVLEQRAGLFDADPLEVEFVMTAEGGILVFYHSKKEKNGLVNYKVGVALFDQENPEKLLWRGNEPVWEQDKEWQGRRVYPIGVVNLKGKLISYWGIEGEAIWAVVYSHYKLHLPTRTKHVSLNLLKSKKNPIISAKKENDWEAFNTFNAAALHEGGKVHLVYRAQGYDYVSVLGYASSKDGIDIDERLDQPIYYPREPFEARADDKKTAPAYMYISGGGYGGVEDPRLTKIDGRIFMTYVAFDSYSPPRLALTSISVDDFLNHRWLWERPVLISPPGVVDKNGCILPEKINGQYVIFHRIYPNILIDFVDHLNFDGTWWLKGEHKIEPREAKWDSRKVGVGAPPLKTEEGWLLIYQAVGNQDPGKYKIGAMLLDLDNPTKVLHRTNAPIVEPSEWYENEGFKAGVVYSCGTVIIDGTLFVYYGGADSVVCVATANLKDFLTELKYAEVAKLEPAFIQQVL